MGEDVIRVHFMKEEYMPFQLQDESITVEFSAIKSIQKGMKICKIKRLKKTGKDVTKMSHEQFLLFTTTIDDNEEFFCDFVSHIPKGKVSFCVLVK